MEFRVTDTGIGIDPEYHAAVFEKFARVSSQGRSFGMGLGLALVKKLIELHGGRVELEFGARPGYDHHLLRAAGCDGNGESGLIV